MIEARCEEIGADALAGVPRLGGRGPSPGGRAGRRSVRGVHATYDELFLPMFGEHAVRKRRARRSWRWSRCSARRSTPDARERRCGRAVAGTPRGRRRAAHRSCSTARTTPPARRRCGRAPRGLHLGPAAPRARRSREQGRRRDRRDRSRRWPTSPTRPRTTASAPATPLLIAEAFAALERRPCRVSTTRSRRRSRRRAPPRTETDLILVTGSLYTVADARRALGGALLDHGHRIHAADRQARRRSPRSRRRGAPRGSRRRGSRSRTMRLFTIDATTRRGALRRASSTSRSSASSSTSSPAGPVVVAKVTGEIAIDAAGAR